jgi:hypothetical protein
VPAISIALNHIFRTGQGQISRFANKGESLQFWFFQLANCADCHRGVDLRLHAVNGSLLLRQAIVGKKLRTNIQNVFVFDVILIRPIIKATQSRIKSQRKEFNPHYLLIPRVAGLGPSPCGRNNGGFHSVTPPVGRLRTALTGAALHSSHEDKTKGKRVTEHRVIIASL